MERISVSEVEKKVDLIIYAEKFLIIELPLF